MPDRFMFDNEPHFGAVFHRCVECGWPGWGVIVPERERERHHRAHARERTRAIEATQKANLAKARKARKQYRQEGAG